MSTSPKGHNFLPSVLYSCATEFVLRNFEKQQVSLWTLTFFSVYKYYTRQGRRQVKYDLSFGFEYCVRVFLCLVGGFPRENWHQVKCLILTLCFPPAPACVGEDTPHLWDVWTGHQYNRSHVTCFQDRKFVGWFVCLFS